MSLPVNNLGLRVGQVSPKPPRTAAASRPYLSVLMHCRTAAPSTSSGSCGFTLLELLSVILLLTILWGLIFPASDAIRRSTRRRQAQTEVISLANAVLNYRDTYGHWPLQDEIDEENKYRSDALDVIYGTNLKDSLDFITLDQDKLIYALTASSHDDSTTENPRQIPFLELDLDRVHEGCYLDPWSTKEQPCPYLIVIDANEDDWIGKNSGNTDSSGAAIPESILVEDDKDDTKQHYIPAVRESVYVFSWSDRNTNRVSSLREP